MKGDFFCLQKKLYLPSTARVVKPFFLFHGEKRAFALFLLLLLGHFKRLSKIGVAVSQEKA
jgi:hypothetical protein